MNFVVRMNSDKKKGNIYNSDRNSAKKNIGKAYNRNLDLVEEKDSSYLDRSPVSCRNSYESRFNSQRKFLSSSVASLSVSQGFDESNRE
jgi:hypothetical protein